MTETNRTLSENSKVQMTEAALRLIQGMPVHRVLQETSIPKARLERWRKDPVFLQLYEDLEDQMASDLRSEAVGLIRKRLDFLGPKAVEVLEEALSSDKMSDRLNAAKAVLAFQGKSSRTEEAKVVSIEQAIRTRAVDVSPAAGD
jgi:hypothetical protein